MIQTRSELHIKDNSGALKARCIQVVKNSGPPGAVGSLITGVITKTAKQGRLKKATQIASKLKTVQKLLITFTRSKLIRLDGSSVVSPKNYGVLVNVKATKANTTKVELGFKRVNCYLPFELKNKFRKGSNLNLLKLAKGRL